MRPTTALVLVASFAIAPAAAASPEGDAAQACLKAHVAVQEKRIAGDLLGARDAAAVCSAAACPALPRAECARWADDVARELPTVTVSVRGAGAAARLTIDGTEQPLDTPVAVNPGHHSIEVSDGIASAHRSIRLIPEQREAITVELAAGSGSTGGGGAGPALDEPEGPALAGPIALGSVGIAGLIAFGVAAGLGASEYADLEERCAPRCTHADTDPVDTKLLAADVALGVGSAALTGGIIWLAVELGGAPAGAASSSARGVLVRF